MKQWLKKRKGRGFTLVELLIVIVIIGILAGSLLLVMGAGTDKANATKIASDMRTLKASLLMYYADNGTFVEVPDFSAANSLDVYLDRTPNSELGAYSVLQDSSSPNNYFVKFKGNTKLNPKVAELLEDFDGIEPVSGEDNAFVSRVGR